MSLYRPSNLLMASAQGVVRGSLPHGLRYFSYQAGEQFWAAGASVPFSVFPLRGIISLQVVSEPAKQVEIGLVGPEGFAGIPLFLGVRRSLIRAVALTEGDAITLTPAAFEKQLANDLFRSGIERYTHSFLEMVAQLSFCNRVHAIEKMCVGRLLLMQDRTRAMSFQITQDYFSRFLGVRRASVNRVAVQLQKIGAIEYNRRGRLTILDRAKLETLACPCYHTIKARYDSLVARSRS